MLRQILLLGALALGTGTASIIAPTAAYAQEQATLQDKMNAEILRLEKKEKTEEELIRLADLYGLYYLPDDRLNAKLQEMANANPEAIYLKAFGLELKKDFGQARTLYEQVVKSKADKRTRSNAMLRKLRVSAPKDLSEDDYLAALKIDDTNLLAYALLFDYQTTSQINGFASANSKLEEKAREQKLDVILKKSKKTYETALKKTDRLPELERMLFRAKILEQFSQLLNSAIYETEKNKISYSKILDTCLAELAGLRPDYQCFVMASRNLQRLYEAEKKEDYFDRGLSAIRKAEEINATGETYYILGDWYAAKADTDKSFAQKAIDAYETALKTGLSQGFQDIAKRRIERMKKKLE